MSIILPLPDHQARGSSGRVIGRFRAIMLFMASVPGLAAMAHAQSVPQTPLPPPPQRSQLLPKPGDPPRRPPPQNEQPRPHFANSMGGLIDYMDRPETETDEEVDAPVTGFGNEALWEPQVRDARLVPKKTGDQVNSLQK